jgi:GNAT superfamily N-acetyltransferase
MIAIDLATPADIDAIKAIADREKRALGFVHRGALARGVTGGNVLAARDEMTLVGFCHVYPRRDGVVTIHHLAVAAERRGQGIGRALIAALERRAARHGASTIRLKCPADLAANDFYAGMGFERVSTEVGAVRALNVWERSCQSGIDAARPPA